MIHNKLFLTIILSCFLSVLMLTQSNAQTTLSAIQSTNTPLEITTTNIFSNEGNNVGWSFTVGAVNITVESLGLYDSGDDGLSESHQVGIWTSSGTLLSSTTIPVGTGATLSSGYRYSSITPIVLSAGQTYVIGALYSAGSGDKIILNSSQTFASEITFNNSLQTQLTFNPGYTPPFGIPNFNAGGHNQGIFGPNFQFDEPASIGSYDIYTVNAKTGNTERITFLDDADEYNPSFAPGGICIVHDVVTSSGQSLYITDISTGVSTPLAGGEGGNDASWSPDSMYIAFDLNGDLYVVPSSGGTATLVRENAIDAEWSNNSKLLVFTDLSDYTLRTIDVNSGSETNWGVQGINASWSPNGKFIAYTDLVDIFTISVNEDGEPKSSPVNLTNNGSGVFSQHPSWSNNGKTIVFHSNRATSDYDIWTIPSSGGTPTRLAGRSDMGDYDPSFSKNGKYVAYAEFTDPGSPKKGFDDESLSSNGSTLLDNFTLDQNFPNPFNPTTQIRFGIPESGNVTLKIYNSVGQLVKTLVDGNMSEGYHQVTWDATDNSGSKLSSGVYFYRITAGTFTQVNKMMFLK
ncbi:MAG: FlgD immunoglobulin-like domain containing protein [Ignavibacteriaceae bacterium]